MPVSVTETILPFMLRLAVPVIPPFPSKVSVPTPANGPTPVMNPVPICEKVPFREALVHPLSAAFTAGAMPRANTIAPAIARVFAVLLCFRIVAFVGLFREETVLPDLLPPVQAEADGKSGHVCAIFFVPAGGGLSISTRPQEITGLLRAWRGGDEAALARLAERVYPELRMIARR